MSEIKELLILTGACGVGKSTMSKKWATEKQGAIVECDYFTEWIYNEDSPNFTLEEEQFTANLSAKVAIEYMNLGMSVAIENVWTPAGIQTLIDKIRIYDASISIKAIWLFCEMEENHRRDRLRIPEDQMKERVDIVNGELSSYEWPAYLTKINSTHLSLEETLEKIEYSNPIVFE